MANLIRIKNLERETNLDNIVIPVDKASYLDNAKQISITGLTGYVLSGFTGSTINYSHPGTTTAIVGGIPVGIQITGMTITEIFNWMLYSGNPPTTTTTTTPPTTTTTTPPTTTTTTPPTTTTTTPPTTTTTTTLPVHFTATSGIGGITPDTATINGNPVSLDDYVNILVGANISVNYLGTGGIDPVVAFTSDLLITQIVTYTGPGFYSHTLSANSFVWVQIFERP